jgi:hypothetical protein
VSALLGVQGPGVRAEYLIGPAVIPSGPDAGTLLALDDLANAVWASCPRESHVIDIVGEVVDAIVDEFPGCRVIVEGDEWLGLVVVFAAGCVGVDLLPGYKRRRARGFSVTRTVPGSPLAWMRRREASIVNRALELQDAFELSAGWMVHVASDESRFR